MARKIKIVNDPLYGFVSIPTDFLFQLIEHPFVQRLRRIKQLGMTDLVYPGATHSRFHHVVGAMHLMMKAVEVLRSKGVEITPEEGQAACAAILLHDLGHGPFSHSLEQALISDLHHEDLSLALMNRMNVEFNGQLDLAIEIFNNTYKKRFLHQLVSGQLDMDRLDYLTRDSFYTGVSEGIVGLERIIQMLHVKNDELVIEEKGIYSIEKFLIARRLMYWQVYLHKTSLAADAVLLSILGRARTVQDIEGASVPLLYFLKRDLKSDEFLNTEEAINNYILLDDNDIWSAIKTWCSSADPILADLCKSLLDRKLPKVKMVTKALSTEEFEAILDTHINKRPYIHSREDASWFVHTDSVKNEAYDVRSENINILMKDGALVDIATASDNYNISALQQMVLKYYVCTLK